ncbi:type II toxin-antitoxin system ParD family antitoxin [Alterisphingorhabdus coralli]|uniref:Type II toxin-antitoxin system ParD family antitoxin n=1 Tax=Alterisphingorhabdus coralli TaxID=3071408 RepID=A0AA97F7T8_9SPHN|nr:type II toxin-antitoxin system ParD family antitoxin [Parasphingorhabdus sp. SCSIO 66989]WOE75761.1 type II toxin-antitoxin system ParD family antitoxin [Parasphingorhabdus sp. SCSIO 66989]
MTQLNVSIPPALKEWIDSRVAEGRYASASDYIRDIIRRDQDSINAETEWLREQIQIGLDSGVSDETPETVIENVIARRKQRHGLG